MQLVDQTIEDLKKRHIFSSTQVIIPSGCETFLNEYTLGILKVNFTTPSLTLRNFPDFLVIDSENVISPYFIEYKKDHCVTVELTQLYQNKLYSKLGISVFYSLGNNLLIHSSLISLAYVIVSPESKEYYDKDWKEKLEREEKSITYYRPQKEIPSGMSPDPFVYVNYPFLEKYLRCDNA